MISTAFLMAFVGAAISMILGIFIYAEISENIGNSFGEDLEIPTTSDGVWQWREHDTYAFGGGDVDGEGIIEVASPNRAELSHNGSSKYGAMYLFKSFPTSQLDGKSLKITWEGITSFSSTGPDARFEVQDGTFDRTSMVDFPDGTGRISKGIGTIDTLLEEDDFGEVVDTLTPDYTGAGDTVTIFAWFHDAHSGTGFRLLIKSIEIVGEETITFDSNTILSAKGGSDNLTYCQSCVPFGESPNAQAEYGTFTVIPLDHTPSFQSQIPTQFTKADGIAMTVLAIIPVTLFFGLFTLFGGRNETF